MFPVGRVIADYLFVLKIRASTKIEECAESLKRVFSPVLGFLGLTESANIVYALEHIYELP